MRDVIVERRGSTVCARWVGREFPGTSDGCELDGGAWTSGPRSCSRDCASCMGWCKLQEAKGMMETSVGDGSRQLFPCKGKEGRLSVVFCVFAESWTSAWGASVCCRGGNG